MENYVLSIKREYGLNLLTSKAKYEYRRRKSKIKKGDKIILYANAPDKEIIGEFIVGGIIKGTAQEVWEKTKDRVCYSVEEVVPYLQSGDYPIAFEVISPQVYNIPIPLSEINHIFRPPISYCKASDELVSKINKKMY